MNAVLKQIIAGIWMIALLGIGLWGLVTDTQDIAMPWGGMARASSLEFLTISFDDTLTVGTRDTSDAIDCRRCDLLEIVGQFNADSCRYGIEYSLEGTYWQIHDSVFVNATPGSVEQNVWRQLTHQATVGLVNTVHYDGFMYPQVRVWLANIDKTNALINGKWRLVCGKMQ